MTLRCGSVEPLQRNVLVDVVTRLSSSEYEQLGTDCSAGSARHGTSAATRFDHRPIGTIPCHRWAEVQRGLTTDDRT